MKKIIDLFKKFTEIAPLDLEIITAKAIHQDRIFVMTNPQYSLSLTEKIRVLYYLHLYRLGYSVAAITNKKEFFGLDFFVNKNVLIPRPETELLVQNVLEEIKKNNDKNIVFDVGSGSGCIAITIAHNSASTKVIGLDISKQALKVAAINNARYGNKVIFLKSNLLSAVKKEEIKKYPRIFIVANLPYLRKEQVDKEPTIQKEPKIALIAKDFGLDLYKKLLLQIKQLELQSEIQIFMEIDPEQNLLLSNFITKIFPEATLESKKDLSGMYRLIKVALKN